MFSKQKVLDPNFLFIQEKHAAQQVLDVRSKYMKWMPHSLEARLEPIPILNTHQESMTINSVFSYQRVYQAL